MVFNDKEWRMTATATAAEDGGGSDVSASVSDSVFRSNLALTKSPGVLGLQSQYSKFTRNASTLIVNRLKTRSY